MARTGKRAKQVMVRFTEAEYNHLQAVAKLHSLSMAEVIRDSVKAIPVQLVQKLEES